MSSSPLISDATLRVAQREKKKAENKLKLELEEYAKIMKEMEDEEKALEDAKNKVKTQLENAEGVTECPLCCNPYGNHLESVFIPYQLGCGHTCCKSCVNKIFKKKYLVAAADDREGPMRIECPFCRKVQSLMDPMITLPEHQMIDNTLRTLLRRM